MICCCCLLETHSSTISPVPLLERMRPSSGSQNFVIVLAAEFASAWVQGPAATRGVTLGDISLVPTGVRACPRSGKSKLLEDLNALTGCGRTSVSKLFLYSRESLLLFCFFSFLDFFSFIFLCFLCLFRLSFFLLCVWHSASESDEECSAEL